MTDPDPSFNAVLAMLPAAVIERIEGRMALVSMTVGDVPLDAGEPVDDVWFPLDTVFSFDQTVSDAVDVPSAAAVALVGSEGVVGFEPLFGAPTAVNRATVRIGGRAVRVPCGALRDEFNRAGVLQRQVARACDALFAQVCGVAACERLHPVQQRLIRWLLSFDDRVRSRELGLTQESLSQLLGVRRVSVSAAARRLQAAGFIAYQRGHLMILDRGALERLSCACYRAIRARYDAYLHDGD